MVYQSYKYFIVRMGISIFFLLTFGFMTLFFIHEIILPHAQIEGTAVKWGLVLFSLVVGFMAYGFMGESRYKKALDDLDDIDLKADERKIIMRFEGLLRFTYSSYFLPQTGKNLRQKAVRKYADYLLGIGREDPQALKLYLSAFLQNPVDTKFRAPLISVLTRKDDLDRRERDLLMAMLIAGDYQDDEIFNHLIRVLLKKKQFTSKTEPLFLRALEKRIKQADQVVEFLLPILLNKKREDELAIRVYLNVLPMVGPTTRKRLLEIVAQSFCAEKFLKVDPVLHSRCAAVYEKLPENEKSRIRQIAEDNNIFDKWKKVKIFSGEDVRALESWKTHLGITRSLVRRVYDGCVWVADFLRASAKNIALKFISGMEMFGARGLAFKLTSISALFITLFVGLIFFEGGKGGSLDVSTFMENGFFPGESSPGVPKFYTVQVAAVTSQKKAERLLFVLKKKKIDGLYVVKVKRQTGGYWFKIRAGRFAAEGEAKRFG
ncbi:MAG: SPOR domain-containing protein, partial [Nitrospinae bacterium]|nr:SPOR domain-containing protein [Nitrospinota bacterium]